MHDPEKLIALFRKDHAQTKAFSLPAETVCASVPKSGTEAFSFAQFRPTLLTSAAKWLMTQNNPLMIRARHWIFLLVLPMFRLSIIGA
ncbi:hypothetical protein CQ12_22250 [Bradyrhizobium jicamae]|uniref:Uncharacterized protein n=1 Tax=Bradyrhizobium jicamae TaxID=280332 RepID=A0A0R3KCN5_9BRAD|nr:hypothetical protein [Bradyrhizobium jicamae]KRQ93265.1 hypothetical protein CQ12_22250 [Bradyrhizobium jicamae]